MAIPLQFLTQSFPTLPFLSQPDEESDFTLEEFEVFLDLDSLIPDEVNDNYLDPEGDIIFL